ncbi:MAG: HlyD family efflux transporter periplasmic adaptor subunit [Hespellia sp.]|nr:HlyD family efflux transporter periplasmic adaptor subunit [Hespellia sp.]
MEELMTSELPKGEEKAKRKFSMQNFRKKFKKIRKKKSFWIATIVTIIILAGLVGFFVVRAKAKQASAVTVTVQSAIAETGSISSTVIGTGTLANAESVDVVVPTGITVDEVQVESGDTVTTGQTLATLSTASIASALVDAQASLDSIDERLGDTSGLSNLEIEELNAQRADVAESISALTTLHDNPVITATADGVIGTLNISDETEITKNSASSSGTGNGSTTSSGNTTNTSATADSTNTAKTQTADASSSSKVTLLQMTSMTEEDETSIVSESAVPAEITFDSALPVTAPIKGNTPQTEIAETDQYTGVITWNCTGNTFKADTVYTATIVLTAKEGYQFVDTNQPVVDCSSYDCRIIASDQSDGNGNTLQVKATYEKTESDGISTAGNNASENTSENAKESTNDSTANSASSDEAQQSAQSESGSTTSASGAGTESSGSAGTGSSSSQTSESTGTSASSASVEVYSDYEAAALTIEKQDNVVIDVNVDELDILSVKNGQTATITLDALENQEFEGTITSVATTATSSSSSSSAKYLVEITVPKDENMLIGMSASATINIEEADNAVLIPITALQEKGDSTFVYTSKDEEGNLSGEVEVETGLSNGSQVAITSGLSEGDTVYYLKSESSSDSSSEMGGMGSQGGEMPEGMGGQGGDRPSGDMGGQSGGMPSGGMDSSK